MYQGEPSRTKLSTETCKEWSSFLMLHN